MGLWADETGSRGKGLVWDAEAPAAVASFPELADDCIIWGGNYFALPPVRFAPSRDREVYSITDKGRAKLGVVTVLTPLRRVGPRGSSAAAATTTTTTFTTSPTTPAAR